MAVTADNDYPRLFPGSERLKDPGRLIRTAAELSDGQFALLAAALAEGWLNEQGTAEINSVTDADPDRRAIAESFLRIKLEPLDDHWAGKRKAIRTSRFLSPSTRIAFAMAAAAAVITAAVMILSPDKTDPVLRQIKTLPSVAVVSVSDAHPAPATPSKQSRHESASPQPAQEPLSTSPEYNAATAVRETPLTAGSMPAIAPVNARLGSAPAKNALEKVKFNTVPASAQAAEEKGWIAGAFNRLIPRSKDNGSEVDGYGIAGACIKGINNVLGWQMELDTRRDPGGGVSSVSFTSSLVTVSAPVKNNGE